MLKKPQMKELPEDWQSWTWRDVQTLVRTHRFDNDQYIGLTSGKDVSNVLVWGNNVHSVEISWRPGVNEGYMVFVEQITFRASTVYGVREYNHETVLLGKFWSAHRAEWCANFLTRALYGLPYDHLIPRFALGQTVTFEGHQWDVSEIWPQKIEIRRKAGHGWIVLTLQQTQIP